MFPVGRASVPPREIHPTAPRLVVGGAGGLFEEIFHYELYEAIARAPKFGPELQVL